MIYTPVTEIQRKIYDALNDSYNIRDVRYIEVRDRSGRDVVFIRFEYEDNIGTHSKRIVRELGDVDEFCSKLKTSAAKRRKRIASNMNNTPTILQQVAELFYNEHQILPEFSWLEGKRYLSKFQIGNTEVKINTYLHRKTRFCEDDFNRLGMLFQVVDLIKTLGEEVDSIDVMIQYCVRLILHIGGKRISIWIRDSSIPFYALGTSAAGLNIPEVGHLMGLIRYVKQYDNDIFLDVDGGRVTEMDSSFWFVLKEDVLGPSGRYYAN